MLDAMTVQGGVNGTLRETSTVLRARNILDTAMSVSGRVSEVLWEVISVFGGVSCIKEAREIYS